MTAPFTEAEKKALFAAMQHFGPCDCHQHGSISHLCAGHSFLNETDRKVDRLTHLQYVKRTLPMWRAEEMRDTSAPVALPGEPVAPDQLPW